jgi:hypothetical protein
MSNTQKNKNLVKDKAKQITPEPKPQLNPKHPKQHPWRICGNYEYLVNACIRHNHDGSTSNIPCKCVTNPHPKNHQDELRFNEIIAMTELYFKDLHDPELRSGIKGFSDKFDHEIIGWAKYKSATLCEKVEDYGEDPDSVMGKFISKYSLLTGGKNPW